MHINKIKWISKQTLESLETSLQIVGKIEGQIKHVIVAMHGYGDTAANFAFLASEMNLQNVLWLFVQGPKPVPISFDGAQWFPLFSDPKEEIIQSQNAIFKLCENIVEVTGLPTDKIFLLGFSQGAALALNCGLKYSKLFGGIVALSGFLIEQVEIQNLQTIDKKNPPIFLAHGLQDQVVFPVTYFEVKNILLNFKNIKVTAKTYPVGHTLSQEEMLDIKKFIEENRV